MKITNAFDELRAENKKLRDAIQARTIELERKNRELEIEAALERVRARSMAMRHTSEIQEVIHTVHEELLKLNISILGGSFIVVNADIDTELLCWGAGGTANTSELIHVPHFGMPFCTNLINGIKQGSGFFTEEFTQQEKKEYFTELFNHHPWSELDGKQQQETLDSEGGYTRSCCVAKHTSIFIVNQLGRKFTEEENGILKRFSKVFEQTYTRFLDLQKAEAQAREAKIEAALEKVRSRTMGMHKADELREVVTVVVERLVDLGVILDANGVVLCTYFPDSKDVLHWIASPDFRFTGSYLLPYFDHPIFNDAWESRLSGDEYFSKSFSVEEKNSFFEYAFEHSDYKHFPDEFKEWVFQNDKHSLSFAWTENAAILIPSHTGVVPSGEDVEILKRFAKVFEQAYVRFMDLQIKEEQSAKILEEKQRLEKTLDNLRLTQQQLIQSEKLASLGELTAGIAHEIQNPLNFVNNFSEMSVDLAVELKEEIKKPEKDWGLIEELMDDLSSNQQKINHHGKRAAAIVTGMLQHSRTSTGTKEPTDLNALADEYLRLAYHGLRAKDASFNAKMETDFDPAAGMVEVIPQDIGRVFLNIINNAFYATQQRLANAGRVQNPASVEAGGYEPTVSISSHLVPPLGGQGAGQVVFKIKDNGTGIPDDVKAKIFQPFFTTKPTGQGTGLGLALAYDIITKGHGGTLEVETKEGEGTEFIIILPSV